MSKYLLVIDTIKNGCGGCPCLIYREYVGWACAVKSKELVREIPKNDLKNNKRPKWCPLKKLPENVETTQHKIIWPEI